MMISFLKEAALIALAVAVLCGLTIGVINVTSAILSPANAFLVSVAVIVCAVFVTFAAAARLKP